MIFVINPCGPYSRYVGVESCGKVCFGSFGSIHTNLQSISYLFCCLVASNLYFFLKKDLVFFQNLKCLRLTKLKKVLNIFQ